MGVHIVYWNFPFYQPSLVWSSSLSCHL